MANMDNKNEIKEAIMSNNTMSDMEKLEAVFAVSKDELKKNDPCLYYAILAVIDNNKKPNPGSYFE